MTYKILHQSRQFLGNNSKFHERFANISFILWLHAAQQLKVLSQVRLTVHMHYKHAKQLQLLSENTIL